MILFVCSLDAVFGNSVYFYSFLLCPSAGLLCGPVPGERSYTHGTGTYFYHSSHSKHKARSFKWVYTAGKPPTRAGWDFFNLNSHKILCFFCAGDSRAAEVLAKNLQPEGGNQQIYKYTSHTPPTRLSRFVKLCTFYQNRWCFWVKLRRFWMSSSQHSSRKSKSRCSNRSPNVWPIHTSRYAPDANMQTLQLIHYPLSYMLTGVSLYQWE